MSIFDGSVVGTTQLVDNGPSSERFDLVIMGDGYQSAQLAQFATDTRSFVDKLFATAPFDDPAVAAAINVHRVDVTSTDSGADDPKACTGGTGATARTYFDASFCHEDVQRLLQVNDMTVMTVARAQVPKWNMAMVIVNSTIYGGSGGAVATFSVHPEANEIGIHEMGHTAFGLADEYEYFKGCGSGETDRDKHPRSEPAAQNVTIDPQATKKWGDLIESTTARPTTSNANCKRCDPQANPVAADTVGTFEGAHTYHCGAYRPQFNCRMRQLGQPFCAVCQRQIRRTLAPYNTQLDLLVADFGETQGWRVDRHPRFAFYRIDLGRVEIVGFGNAGVWVSRRQIDGSFSAPAYVLADLGYDQGWRVERHPRFVADTTGTGRADVVGFGNAGVYVWRAQPDGSYAGSPVPVIADLGYDQGWRVERHPRFMADTTGDRRADIVGFGSAGVVISHAQPDGSFTDETEPVVRSFGSSAGGWRVDRHPRFMADTTGDGVADIVGFGDDGVLVSRAQPDGRFTAPELVVANFGYDAGWRVDQHPRLIAEFNPGRAIGFRGDGVWGPRAQQA